MSGALVAGLLAGYGVAVPVGAIAALIVSLSARTSLRVGVAAALGVATADGIYAVVAVVAGAGLARFIEPMATHLRWTASAVLLVLASRSAMVAVRAHRDPAHARSPSRLTTPARAYAGLFALTLLNPMTIVYFGALVVGRRAGDGLSVAGEGAFVVAAFAASASWQLLLACGGRVVGRVLTGPLGRLVTALAASGVIAVLAVGLLVAA